MHTRAPIHESIHERLYYSSAMHTRAPVHALVQDCVLLHTVTISVREYIHERLYHANTQSCYSVAIVSQCCYSAAAATQQPARGLTVHRRATYRIERVGGASTRCVANTALGPEHRSPPTHAHASAIAALSSRHRRHSKAWLRRR